jgi:hypothetical protein
MNPLRTLTAVAALSAVLAGPAVAGEPAPPTLELYCFSLLDVIAKQSVLEGEIKAIYDDARQRLATKIRASGYDFRRDPSPLEVAGTAVIRLVAAGDVTKVEDAVLRCMTVATR